MKNESVDVVFQYAHTINGHRFRVVNRGGEYLSQIEMVDDRTGLRYWAEKTRRGDRDIAIFDCGWLVQEIRR